MVREIWISLCYFQHRPPEKKIIISEADPNNLAPHSREPEANSITLLNSNAYINSRGLHFRSAKPYRYAEDHMIIGYMISFKIDILKKEAKEHMDNSHNPDDIQQNRNILKEIASINQQARDQNAYKKTTNWNQQSADAQVPGQAGQLEQIIQRLNQIDEKLDSLGKMIK